MLRYEFFSWIGAPHGLKRTAVRGHAWSIDIELKYIVRYWSGQQKRATCFATLPQNELKSDLARFSTHVHTCLVALSGCPGCEKLFQKVESIPTFCKKICHVAQLFYLPKANLLCSKWRNSCVWPVSPVILSSEESVFMLATTWFVARQVWTWVEKRATSLFNLFCRNLRNKLHVFVASFTVALSTTKNRWNRNLTIWKLGTVCLTLFQNK